MAWRVNLVVQVEKLPATIKSGLSKADADEIAKKLVSCAPLY
jgi:ribosomal protein L7/L12